MKNTTFSNPIDPPNKKEIKSPWNFDQPPYDQRSSCFVNAGTHYGVGHKVPVGHSGDPKGPVPCLPKDHPNGMEVNYIHKGKVANVEIKKE